MDGGRGTHAYIYMYTRNIHVYIISRSPHIQRRLGFLRDHRRGGAPRTGPLSALSGRENRRTLMVSPDRTKRTGRTHVRRAFLRLFDVAALHSHVSNSALTRWSRWIVEETQSRDTNDEGPSHNAIS